MACLREPCPPVDGCKKEEINTSPPRGWPFQEMFSKTDSPFYFTSSPPLSLYSTFLLYFPLWFCKRNWHPDPNKMFFLGTLVRHLLGLPAFRIKPCSLPQHLASRFTGPSCGEHRELGLSNWRRAGCCETGGKGAGHNLWKHDIARGHDINWLEPSGSKMADKSTSTRPWASLYTHCNTAAG